LLSHDPQRIREELFKPTIENALRTDFYRSLWAGFSPGSYGTEDLVKFPLVTRDAIKQAGRSAQIREGLVCDEIFTMGTTSASLVTIRGDREQRAIAEYLESRHFKATVRRRILKFKDPFHGSHIHLPVPGHCHHVSIYDTGSFEHARLVLASWHRDSRVEPRCTVLAGGARCLKAFTLDTLSACNQVEASLEYVLSVGDYLTQHFRKLIENAWKARIVDRFTLSEVFGGATQSLSCGWYHFDEFVIPEVISLNTGTPIREGVGILVLTALYPFQEAQPLVRYVTGDLVAVTHKMSSKPDELAIKPLGRAKYGVPLPDSDDWLVTPASVLEAVDGIAEVGTKPLFRDAEQVKDPYAVGLPIYNLRHENDGGAVKLTLRIAIRPDTPLAREAVIREIVVHRLLADNNVLRGCARSGQADIQVVFEPPQSFGEIDIISRPG